MELERSQREKRTAAQLQTAEAVHQVADAIRRSAYDEVAGLAREIDLSVLNQKLRAALDTVLMAAYSALSGKDALNVLEICEFWGRLAESASPEVGPHHANWSASAALALYGKAHSLWQLDRNEEALRAYSEVIRRFGQAKEPVVRVQVAWALIEQGVIIAELGDQEGAMERYSKVVRLGGGTDEPSLKEAVDVARILLQQASSPDPGTPED